MRNSLMCLLLIAIVSCTSQSQKTPQTSETPETKMEIASADMHKPVYGPFLETDTDKVYEVSHPHPYELKLNMYELEMATYDLEISIELKDGAHFVSPNSKGDFKGVFKFVVDENSALEFTTPLIETPLSKEEYDDHPYVNGYVNWVRENTKYNKKIKRTLDKDFQVKGLIQFTIEPRCTLEKIPVIIKYKDGKMTFERLGC